jgi:hypothetical protein
VLISGWILCYDLIESKIENLDDNLGIIILSLVLERALKKVPDPCARRSKRRRRGRRSRKRRTKDIKPNLKSPKTSVLPRHIGCSDL